MPIYRDLSAIVPLSLYAVRVSPASPTLPLPPRVPTVTLPPPLVKRRKTFHAEPSLVDASAASSSPLSLEWNVDADYFPRVTHYLARVTAVSTDASSAPTTPSRAKSTPVSPKSRLHPPLSLYDPRRPLRAPSPAPLSTTAAPLTDVVPPESAPRHKNSSGKGKGKRKGKAKEKDFGAPQFIEMVHPPIPPKSRSPRKGLSHQPYTPSPLKNESATTRQATVAELKSTTGSRKSRKRKLDVVDVVEEPVTHSVKPLEDANAKTVSRRRTNRKSPTEEATAPLSSSESRNSESPLIGTLPDGSIGSVDSDMVKTPPDTERAGQNTPEIKPLNALSRVEQSDEKVTPQPPKLVSPVQNSISCSPPPNTESFIFTSHLLTPGIPIGANA